MIIIQNIGDSECIKSCLVRYLNPADNHPARIPKADKDFAKKLDSKDIQFRAKVKVRDVRKINNNKKKKVPSELVFLVMKIRKNIQFMY